jgi:hypothetical protein
MRSRQFIAISPAKTSGNHNLNPFFRVTAWSIFQSCCDATSPRLISSER